MGWLDRIFGKKETVSETIPEKEEEQIFSIEDAESYLSKTFVEEFGPFREEVNKIHQKILSVATSMQKSLKELAESKFSGPVDSELLQKVVGHRRSFIHKMEIMIEQLKRPISLEFDPILEYSRLINSAIVEADQKTVNDYHFLKELFEREAEDALDNFKTIKKMSDDLKNLVNSNKGSMLSIKEVQNGMKSVKEEINNLSIMEENMKSIETKISGLKMECEKEIEKIKQFENREEWIKFNELLDRKEGLVGEISELKSKMMQYISRIDRPLRKLKNLVDRQVVEVEGRRMLEKYVNSPFDAMVEEKNSEGINSILEIVQKNISEGKIEMKDREKSLEEIKWILENNVFEGLLKDYLMKEENLEELERIIDEDKTIDRKEEIEKGIKDLEKKMEMEDLEINAVKRRMDRVKNSINEKKIKLEELLSGLANKKIGLKFIS